MMYGPSAKTRHLEFPMRVFTWLPSTPLACRVDPLNHTGSRWREPCACTPGSSAASSTHVTKIPSTRGYAGGSAVTAMYRVCTLPRFSALWPSRLEYTAPLPQLQ
jgi:hypothetical protein